MINIEAEKKRLIKMFAEVEDDMRILGNNIKIARNDLVNVHTVDDAKAFDNSHDLEAGLKYISLL